MATTKKADSTITPERFRDMVVHQLRASLGTYEEKASSHAWWLATCAAVNELVFEGVSNTRKTHATKDTRSVAYLSLEFLMGRLLSNNLHNLELFGIAEAGLKQLGVELTDILEEEPDMALGNGGLGRLAACFLDSLATLNMPAVGYGIHYEHGLFRQEFHKGRQVERPDTWREFGNPWEICRPESVQEVPLYGWVETTYDSKGKMHKVWHPGRMLQGVPWDVPVVGLGGKNVNILRLWESRASKHFNFDVFNAGGYVDAHRENLEAETVSKVLYPNDETEAGKELRLIQQYFFCACSLKDILRRFKRTRTDLDELPEQLVVQLNDTHPAIAVPELMRTLIDEEGLDWDHAFGICRKVFAYTNHTLLPEALETWSVDLISRVLPRHMEIIFEINHRFLMNEVAQKWPGDVEKLAKLSIIAEGEPKLVRMGHLSAVGSFKVNGVAQIHSQLVKTDLFPEMNELWPGKFTNVTNGVTPRRWIASCNPELAAFIDKQIGEGWLADLPQLSKLAAKAKNKTAQKQYMAIKRNNKQRLADAIFKEMGIKVSPDALFDVQIKRLHEYKRQHLNLLNILAMYREILLDPAKPRVPRVFIFGAKAAPGYHFAKTIIYAINRVAEKINNDPLVGDKLKVVFMPNYRVSLAEKMIPAADLSEQISTAGKEASGTGNMKLALNGAITIGTLDGANIEIAEEVGEDNCLIFGLTVDEVKALNRDGYHPYGIYEKDEELKSILDWLDTGFFTPEQPGALSDIKQNLIHDDGYKVLADYRSYRQAQQKADEWFQDTALWAEKAMLNTAMLGKFSSDRSIQDYCDNIWQLDKVPAKV
ncbi:glycogen/starch/alpha-glucan phosphorylase [Salinibius halmophilus]|uniref:glycogen/starch/alpha-glucan phosphorylase n=1 Tax=Salinibius halmophilus TaxID=1853216 RepID=UPI000E662B3D|nr:glycogen/starch/alpha-glucan phosphorylase [Salinibius halmophilus]